MIRFRQSILSITTLGLLAFVVACSTTPSHSEKAAEGKSLGALSPVGETFYDGNRAPASMAPPFDMSPDKVSLDPIYMRTKADYHFALAEAYGYDGESGRSIEEYKLASVYDPNSPVIRLKIAVEYVRKGMLSEGLAQAEEASKMDPNYIEARILLAGIYSSIKLYDKAEEQYRYIIDHNKDNKEVYLYLGALLTEQKRYKEALALFAKLSKDADYETPHLAYYYMARVHNEKGDQKQAEANYIKALQVKPDFAEGVLALGNLYETQKKREKTLKIYESFQDKQGPSEKVAEQLARLYLEDEKYQQAYHQLEIVVGNDSENLNARVKMALILIEMKDYPNAIVRLKEILATAPDSDKIRFFLGAVYEEVKDFKAATEQFVMIQPSSTYYVEAAIHASYLHKLQGDYKSAIATIEKAVSVRPDSPQFYPLYASYLDDTKQYEKAVKVLNDAIARFPSSDQLFFFLGSMQDKTGDRKGTVVSMRKAIEINPDHVQAMNYLAYTYADMNEHLDEAYTLAKKAMELKPDDAYIQDTLGWVYFKQGNYTDAAKVLEVAHRQKTDESIIAEHLGDAYYKLKLPGKAKEMYKKALRFETNGETAKKLESKITAIDHAGRMPASEP